MNNIRKYLDSFFSELCDWDEKEEPMVPHGLVGYIAVTLAEGEDGCNYNDLVQVERLKLLYQIYQDAGDYTIDSLDTISEKINITNNILRNRGFLEETPWDEDV